MSLSQGRPSQTDMDARPIEYSLPWWDDVLKRGWLSAPVRISVKFGNQKVWPGDTFGISAFPRDPGTRLGGGGPKRIVLSWGSAVAKRKKPDSGIFAAVLK